MTTETPPRISLCFDQLQLYVPRSRAYIARARKLLNMLEAEIEEGEIVEMTRQREESELKPQGSPQTSPQDERPRQHTQPSPEKPYGVPAPIQQVLSTPQIEASTPTQGDQGELGTKTSEIEKTAYIAKLTSFSIPMFAWDKTKEKSYRTIFFFEHEDGERVMIFYLNSRIFTTKAAVMTLPYPVPCNYAPLRKIPNNKKTALKFYREYLAKEAHSREIDSAIRNDEEQRVAKEAGEQETGDLTQLYNAIVSEAAKESEEKRLEKLKKAADVNKSRWTDRVETEMSPRTKELREKFGFRGIEIHDRS